MTLKTMGKTILVFALALGLTSAGVLGQSGPTGALSGVVTDPSGAIMVSVGISVRNAGTGLVRSTTTDADGRWTVGALPVGRYEVSYQAANFKQLTQDGVAVEAAITRTLPAQLEVEAAPGQTIRVSESVELATPDTATTFAQITGQELTNVPSSTRSFTHLLSSEAGVSSDLPPVLTNGTGNISPSVNGTRTTSTSLSFNGIDATNLTSNEGSLANNIAPAPETLEEVKLQTSMYDASTGRSGGGNFQLVTKSGTNAFHGSAVWYVQNEVFNANDFFFNKDGIDRPKARRNEGGFTLGGPILKDRMFFFGGYQRTQAITGFVPTATSVSVLPEALGLINGARTKQAIWDAFSSSNPNFAASVPRAECNSPTDRGCISDAALNLLNLRNPVTEDYFIPAPRPGGTFQGVDANVTGSNGGNRFIRQRNVEPSRFTQDQVTGKIDTRLSDMNTLSGTFFFARFPGYDSFPDPASLVSPVTLKRDDLNRTIGISDTHIFGSNITNEARFGYFFLKNTRVLDDPFLGITNEMVGVPNPAVAFDQGPGTMRLGHYVGRPGTTMERFSFGGPNDSFNRREQTTYSFSDTMSYIHGRHVFRFGGEFKTHRFNSALPEEQATEFEKFDNFTQLLRGVATEGDTQFGITEKRFRMNDLSWFITDDFKLNPHLTLQLGVRWEWFGWPEEKDGFIGNFDPSLVTNSDNPLAGFIVPSNVTNTGFNAIDTAIAASARTSTKHTLNGQDLNNFAPRFGFAWTPGSTNRVVVRGGYGIFFDRPSAAFINTIFSNYPFLRESEVTFPGSQVPLTTAWSQQDPNFPFNQYLPNRVVRTGGTGGTYQIRDGTNVTLGADGTPNAIDPATGLPFVGNIAETFEFRAVDRNLRTPYIQQWNLSTQYELTKDLLIEVRYVGSKGTKLLQATSFTQGYDLNDPSTPDAIFERFNAAYVAAGAPNGALNAGATARERGVGKAFGFPNAALNGMVDYNLANSGGAVITFEGRARYLGFDVPEAILLGNSAYSNYHSGQIAVIKRFASGMGFDLAYTYSRSMDNASADPGSTAGGGKPDLPNVGFTSQGDAFNTRANYAPSDFDRTHRFSANFLYELPTFGSTSRWVRGWNLSGFYQVQSGVPFTIFSPETTVGNASNYTNTPANARLGAAGLYRLAFGRPSLCGSLDQLREQADDITEGHFNPSVLCNPLSLAGGYPNNRGFGNLGRNVLRGPHQQRFDLGFAKKTPINEQMAIEFRWDVFNVFNNVNFATPNSVMADPASPNDFTKITDTVGGPRVMQFGARLTF
ncbi:MAG TPA: carboxypeptidase-like regulatory domain-containing protein [Terriglobia bacterium]|nr:carboxypeptidase-like regulatory domain-containing protein [Terriglobia bacterium]